MSERPSARCASASPAGSFLGGFRTPARCVVHSTKRSFISALVTARTDAIGRGR